MYIDRLTIIGLVIFVISLVVIVRFCVFSLCGGPLQDDSDKPPKE
jgi:hypothetical protein